MRALCALLALVMIVPAAYGELEIAMEKPVFSYCDTLNYTVIVSEVTGDPAMIHIRDSAGVSSLIPPIPIISLETPLPAENRFERSVFLEGTYYVDVAYAGEKATAEFEIKDSGELCFSNFSANTALLWAQGRISDGFLVDALQRDVPEIDIPFEIDESNVYDVDLPGWAANVGALWAAGVLTDGTLVDMVNYLAEKNLIIPEEREVGI